MKKQKKKKEKEIMVSACVIVKNEAGNLPRWLDSMRQIADEMIVVDTGSTDDTVALARQAGARVFHFDWNDDFAAAKNYALDQAHGQWILFLDADEYFTKESIPRIRPLLHQAGKNPQTLGILCRLVNVDVDAGWRMSSAIIQQRIFRHRLDIRYTGAIHESLTIPQESVRLLADDITIYHTGYSTSVAKKKMQRNRALMQVKIRKQGGVKPLDYGYLMDIAYGLGEYREAIDHARQMLSYPDLAEDYRERAYEIWTSSCIEGKFPEEETIQALREARAAFPRDAEFVLMQGLWLYESGDYLSAEDLLQQGLSLYAQWQRQQRSERQSGNSENISVTALIDNAERLLPTVDWRLGQLCMLRGDMAGAQTHYLAGLKRHRYHTGLLSDFLALLRRLGAANADVIELLNGLYDVRHDAGWLAQELAQHHGGDVYVYYLHRSGGSLKSDDALMATRNYQAAAVQAAAELSQIYGLAVWSGHDDGICSLIPSKQRWHYADMLKADSNDGAQE